ncbi:MAG: hypothetical protein A2046_10500 [Bacteroidetes bacterium GWA2_30_7]|nr:MAG: hypothetical protein A2046_10500 [Bacteroidetes bacterium GWA2_30_7]
MKTKVNWLPLFLSNYLGVFNDNLLKNLICFISIYWVARGNESIIIMLATGFMVLPYILFSPYAGFLAKTLQKQKIVLYAKFAEIPIMIFAFTGFWIENIYIVMIGMFFMGLQSCIYSPSKYGLIREIGGEEKISFGTGMIEMLTFMGVLTGTFIAGVISDIIQNQIWIIFIAFMIISISGYICGLYVKAIESEPLKKSNESLNPISFIIKNYKWSLKNSPELNYVVLGLATFWLVGSMIQMNMLIHCPQNLGLSNTETGVVMALVAISIGLGTWISGLIAKKHVEVGIIPVGGIGLTLSTLIIYIVNPGSYIFTILIMLAAFSAGLLKVPLNAWMQANIKGRKLGDAIAYNNLVDFVFILISAGLFGFLETIFGSRNVFLVITLLSLFLTLFLVIKLKGVKQSFSKVFKISL